jgi:hypothetical protein
MPTTRIVLGKDTWAGSGHPDLNHNGDQKLRLQSPGTNTAYAYIRQGIKLPVGAVVSSATITVYAAGASTGSRTLSAQRIAAGWKPGDLTYNHRPGVIGTAATAAVGTLADGDPIVFTVTSQIQTIVGAAPNYGFRISTSGTTAHRIWGFDSDYPPVLSIVWSIPPTKPTSLIPSTASIATGLPTVSWPYVDPDGSNLDAVKVQIDAANNFVSGIDFDSGWVTSEVSELDLSTTAYAGLANLATTYWRAQVRDQDGGESAWSDPVPFTRTNQGTLAISAPSGSTIKDATPTVTWGLTGATQAFWMVRVMLSDQRQVELFSTGKRTGTTTSYTLPEGVIDDEGVGYILQVTVWDNVHRQAVPGFPTYVRASKTVTVADGAAGAPSALSATPDANTPAVVLTWTATAPDTFTIVRDGKVIKALLDPADALVSGSTYTYTDWTASPRTQHSYAVRRVVAGDQSPKCAPATATPRPKGVWLVDSSVTPARWIVARGNGVDDWERADSYALYRVLGAAAPVKVTSAMGGLDGTFVGELWNNSFVSTATQLDTINLMLAHPDRTLRLVAGHINIPVVVGDLSSGVHELLLTNLDRAKVKWKFWQVGELSFRVPV